MKLSRNGIKNPLLWEQKGYALPEFDIDTMTSRTAREPIWLHMGAGNLLRVFPAVMQQQLLDNELTDRGIIVCECFDEEIIPAVFAPHDNLTLAVTLLPDGTMEKTVVAGIAEALSISGSNGDKARLLEVFAAPSLQMVSFTITEKGYTIQEPPQANSIINVVAEGLMARYHAGATPLALVSMDNCSQNGDVLKQAVLTVAQAWVADGTADAGFALYVRSLAYPWTMIDKIAPRPSPLVAAALLQDGFEDVAITVTQKHTHIAPFANAEKPQYLVVEDDFPNGRPPLEKAGMIATTRETVDKAEKMKVCTCLNPLHTMLAIAGCLLGYKSVAETMQDKHLVAWLKRAAAESLPIVADPVVINPKAFLREVLEERFPNPHVPDTPQRIATDASQCIPVRFGETLKLRRAAALPEDELQAHPFLFALYLRYLMGVNDKGQPMAVESDPRREELCAYLSGLALGCKPDNTALTEQLHPILSDATLFGVDLHSKGGVLARKTQEYFADLIAAPGAVALEMAKHFKYSKRH